MYKKAKILFFCMIFVVGAAFGQELSDTHYLNTRVFYTTTNFLIPIKFAPLSFKQQESYKRSVKTEMQPIQFINPIRCSVVESDFYTKQFGFFCKQELQFEKATKIPLKFRLGSLQYNDYLEAKPNSGIHTGY